MLMITTVLAAVMFVTARSEPCPWPEDMTDLYEACMCQPVAPAQTTDDDSGDSGSTAASQLDIRCVNVNTGRLLGALRGNIDISTSKSGNTLQWRLQIINSSVPILLRNTFTGLPLRRLKISGCHLRRVHNAAFAGLEAHLQQLSLSGNQLQRVPSEALSRLQAVQSISLADNRISAVPEGAFRALPSLHTLDLSDNNITQLHSAAFTGLEDSLRTLLLKNIRQTHIPQAINRLSQLSFLDLAQNYLASLPPRAFSTLDSLSALNLERNLIQTISINAFDGISDTLSSLSLLNNLLAEFPSRAVTTLRNLRVLDAGFNLIGKLEPESLAPLESLTLLALDGNPISTLPEAVFAPVRSTLRGLSLGGRFLSCDCRLRWVIEWMRDSELQVTSRERSPQFCGQPAELRDRTLYQLNVDEMVCEEEITTSSLSKLIQPPKIGQKQEAKISEQVTTTELPEIQTASSPAANADDMMTLTVKADLIKSTTTTTPPTIIGVRQPTAEVHVTHRRVPTRASVTESSTLRPLRTQPPYQQRASPNRVRQSPSRRTTQTPTSLPPQMIFRQQGLRAALGRSETVASSTGQKLEEVRVLEAYRRDDSVVIQWDTDVRNILGFRVVYRLFGDNTFKQGPPLAASEKEFKIKNVPPQECIVVCVVSLEEIEVTPDTVAQRQCREIRTDPAAPVHMDTFVIGASAAICATIVLAVVIFICCNRRRHSEKQQLPAILPAGPTAAGGPPLASMGTMRVDKDWDQISMYSQRSIPRARMYHADKVSIHNGFGAEELRTHMSRASSRRRSVAERQSMRSYSGLSVAHLPTLGSSHALALPRPDLRASRTSLASGYIGAGAGSSSLLAESFMDGGGGIAERRRSRRLSRSHSRLSAAGGTSYFQAPPPPPAVVTTGEDTDGWTDHDMDIYMTTNATTRDTNLVQL